MDHGKLDYFSSFICLIYTNLSCLLPSLTLCLDDGQSGSIWDGEKKEQATDLTYVYLHVAAKPSPSQSKRTKTTTTKTQKSSTVKVSSSNTDDPLVQDMQGLGLGDAKDIARVAAQNRFTKSDASTPAATPPETPRAASPLAKIPAAKRINVLEEYAKRSSDKPKLNLVVIGRYCDEL